jgi:hypothetical protein
LNKTKIMMSSTDVFQQCIQCNNEGIKHLESGDTVEASTAFAEASSTLGNYSQPQTPRAGQKRRIQYSTWVELSSKSVLYNIGNKKVACNEPLPILFLRAIAITPSEDIDTFHLTWAVLYNLALACHLLACKLGANGRRHLKKSHELYDIIRKRYLPQVPSEQSAYLSLAIHNNMACIYQEFAMHIESESCLTKANEMLYMISKGTTEPSGDLKEISLNLMVSSKRPARAPAA